MSRRLRKWLLLSRPHEPASGCSILLSVPLSSPVSAAIVDFYSTPLPSFTFAARPGSLRKKVSTSIPVSSLAPLPVPSPSPQFTESRIEEVVTLEDSADLVGVVPDSQVISEGVDAAQESQVLEEPQDVTMPDATVVPAPVASVTEGAVADVSVAPLALTAPEASVGTSSCAGSPSPSQVDLGVHASLTRELDRVYHMANLSTAWDGVVANFGSVVRSFVQDQDLLFGPAESEATEKMTAELDAVKTELA